MKRNLSVPIFYLGTFASSFGSLLLVMSVPAFFIKVGMGPAIIGILIGIHRFSGMAASALFGPKIDKFNSKLIIFWTEIAAAVASIGLFIGWTLLSQVGIYTFASFLGIRAFAVGAQSSSRNRLIKKLSEGNTRSEARSVIWLNKVTQGATVFSALVALPLIARGNFTTAIIIDCVSFVVGGLSVLDLPVLDRGSLVSGPSNLYSSFKNLIALHKKTFIKDQVLALAVSGTILLMVKISRQDPSRIIIFNLLFGVCIWASSVFVHNQRLNRFERIYWLMSAIGFEIISLTVSFSNLLFYFGYFLTYLGYWVPYHKYTVQYQVATDTRLIGAVMAARALFVALTLSIGELFGGYISGVISIQTELHIRAAICIAGIVLVGSGLWCGKKASLTPNI